MKIVQHLQVFYRLIIHGMHAHAADLFTRCLCQILIFCRLYTSVHEVLDDKILVIVDIL